MIFDDNDCIELVTSLVTYRISQQDKNRERNEYKRLGKKGRALSSMRIILFLLAKSFYGSEFGEDQHLAHSLA